MSKQTQFRRGTTSEHNSFTGAVGEVTVDTSKDTTVVHDGSTAGGHPVALEKNVPNGTNSSITDDGTNVGIGTSSPSAKLDVVSHYGRTEVLGNGHLAMWNDNVSETERWHLAPRNSGHLDFGFGSPNDSRQNEDSKVSILSSGGIDISQGNVKVDSGYGIDFSANPNASGMTSEVLDDYEEGTWTPSIVSGATQGANAFGTYTKIGRWCHIYLYIDTTNCTTSGNVVVGGIPFSVKDNSGLTSVENTGTVWGKITKNFAYISQSEEIYISNTNSETVGTAETTNNFRGSMSFIVA